MTPLKEGILSYRPSGSTAGAPPKTTIPCLGFPDECSLGPTTAVGAVCHQAPASTELQSGLFGGGERTEATMIHHLFPALDGGEDGGGVHDVGPHDDDGRMKFEEEARNEDDQFVARPGPCLAHGRFGQARYLIERPSSLRPR